MDEDKEIALEYFKALRSEIDLRIRNHAYLSISKIVACAALLGQLVSNKAVPGALLAVPILAFSLDLIIYHNLARINGIGQYIKTEIEDKVFKKQLSRNWELYEQLAQSDKQGFVDIIFDRLGQIIITGLLAVVAYFLSNVSEEVDIKPCWFLWTIVVLLVIDVVAVWLSKARGNSNA